MTTLTHFVGDEREDFTGKISFLGSPNLIGATVTLTAINSDEVKVIDAGECTVDIDNDEKTIEWTYEVQDGDLDVTALYYVYLTVTHSDGDIQTVARDANKEKLTVNVINPYG